MHECPEMTFADGPCGRSARTVGAGIGFEEKAAMKHASWGRGTTVLWLPVLTVVLTSCAPALRPARMIPTIEVKCPGIPSEGKLREIARDVAIEAASKALRKLALERLGIEEEPVVSARCIPAQVQLLTWQVGVIMTTNGPIVVGILDRHLAALFVLLAEAPEPCRPELREENRRYDHGSVLWVGPTESYRSIRPCLKELLAHGGVRTR